MTTLSPARAGALLLAAGTLTSIASAQCQVRTITPPAGAAEGGFGLRIAASADRFAVSSYVEVPGSQGTEGIVHLFRDQGAAGWQLSQSVTMPSAPGLRFFGEKLGFGGDVLAVLTRNEPGAVGPTGLPVSSSIFVFERQGSDFVLSQQLDTGVVSDALGFNAVHAVDANDATIVAGYSDLGLGWAGGAVATYERSGSLWISGPTISAPAGFGNANFGGDVDLDGNQLLVAQWPGFVHHYERSAGTWQYTQTFATSACSQNSGVMDVALAGNQAFVSVYETPADCPSHIEIFERPAAGLPFAASQTLLSPVTDPQLRWGQKMVAEPNRLVVGSPSNDTSAPFTHSEVHVYDRGPSGWVAGALLTPSWPANNHTGAARSLALVGNTVVNGAYSDNSVGVAAGSVSLWSIDGSGCPSLAGVPDARSIGYVNDVPGYAPAGRQDLVLDAGQAHAGELYLVLGSVTGTAPGINLDGQVLPLVFDAWTAFTLSSPNSGPLQSTFGVLDSQGRALAAIQLAAPLDGALAGLTLHHAFVTLGTVPLPTVTFASEAAPLSLLP
ncbi:hypothetical protein [Engelhardtia mirabilis]|uniref:FG-GAP repeat protein n=1 Tax=Engelhardtia mirabilis TaxID=2528011 RepID=A0A518BJQ9_9BACT|nr:hypothetical protein Pla133_22920 [Planctomycetes bacterium Pla133]QDV01541.1 hypothetical protein Pla86_22920 [Planctomycetes bacterium Pla86]